MSEINFPPDWVACSISDVAQVNPKKIDAEPDTISGFVPMALAPASFSDSLRYEEKHWKEIKKSYTNFQNGDVIFAKVTPCFENGKAAIVDGLPNGIGAGSSEFYVLRPHTPYVLPEILLALIKTQKFANDGAANMTGAVGLRRVPRAFVESFDVPMIPMAEQKVIAKKLDTLLAQVEATKARLESTLKTLNQFRQSVLAAAVSGKLTEDLREKNTNLTVDTVQIAQEHKDYFINLQRKYKEPLQFKASESTPTIPDSWIWYRAEQLCDLITKGTTPKKENMSSKGDVPYIKVYNLTFDGSLDFSIDPTFVPYSVHNNELKRSKVFPGDVLMNIVGPPLGKVSIVPDSYDEWNINQAISIFRPVCGISNQYLSICLRDGYLLDLTKSKAKATAGQFNLTLEICRDYSIPVPPLEEQNEIVRRVNKLLSGSDVTEQKVNQALELVNNLTQSILAKAFQGELTEQWRKENPELISGENSAEELLKKIKAERAAAKPKPKAGKARA